VTAAVLDLTTQEGKPHAVPQKLSLECSACGYGIARAEPPERCPMCQAVDSWAHRPWRPFSATV
jgi:rubrerythrin